LVVDALEGTPDRGPLRKEERVLSSPKAKFRSLRKLLRAVESVGIAVPATDTSKGMDFLRSGYSGKSLALSQETTIESRARMIFSAWGKMGIESRIL
jgi:hypothetical protein